MCHCKVNKAAHVQGDSSIQGGDSVSNAEPGWADNLLPSPPASHGLLCTLEDFRSRVIRQRKDRELQDVKNIHDDAVWMIRSALRGEDVPTWRLFELSMNLTRLIDWRMQRGLINEDTP